jgi:hypothetical protein
VALRIWTPDKRKKRKVKCQASANCGLGGKLDRSRAPWFTTVIPAKGEAEIGRITLGGWH